jgi:hypothetical protein
LSHTYADGNISLVSAIDRFECAETLEPEEWDEAVELLSKVSPGDWPHIEDISGISLEELLHIYDEDASEFDFVEDNLSTAEKVERVLIEAISSVFGDRVSTIRSEKGYYPNQKNSFLQEDDGTFAGTFMYDDHRYIFEVYPDENGWAVTYRMHWNTFKDLPPKTHKTEEEKDHTRRVRHRSWR